MDWLQGLIGLISGGGILAIITAIFEYRKNKKADTNKHIDDRISFWENVAKMNDDRIGTLERKIEHYDLVFRTLDNHISVLEHLLIRIKPDIDLPERPAITPPPSNNK